MVQREPAKIAAVHGYEVVEGGRLGDLCQAVCEFVWNIQTQYDHILLLAGMHLRGVEATVDVTMQQELIRLGVPAAKLFTKTALCPEYRPPRTTVEEVDVLPRMLRRMGKIPRQVPFDVVGADIYAPVFEFLVCAPRSQRPRNPRCKDNQPKKGEGRKDHHWLVRRFPKGNGPVFAFFKWRRNVFPFQPNGRLWLPNEHTAWDES